jgi:hypothetical protein
MKLRMIIFEDKGTHCRNLQQFEFLVLKPMLI